MVMNAEYIHSAKKNLHANTLNLTEYRISSSLSCVYMHVCVYVCVCTIAVGSASEILLDCA